MSLPFTPRGIDRIVVHARCWARIAYMRRLDASRPLCTGEWVHSCSLHDQNSRTSCTSRRYCTVLRTRTGRHRARSEGEAVTADSECGCNTSTSTSTYTREAAPVGLNRDSVRHGGLVKRGGRRSTANCSKPSKSSPPSLQMVLRVPIAHSFDGFIHPALENGMRRRGG